MLLRTSFLNIGLHRHNSLRQTQAHHLIVAQCPYFLRAIPLPSGGFNLLAQFRFAISYLHGDDPFWGYS